MNRPILAIALNAVLCGACATHTEPAKDIEWSAKWFQCESRFECVAVYDAYCKYNAVNLNYVLVYQDWARQQVQRSEELIPCEPVGENKSLTARCRNKVCQYP